MTVVSVRDASQVWTSHQLSSPMPPSALFLLPQRGLLGSTSCCSAHISDRTCASLSLKMTPSPLQKKKRQKRGIYINLSCRTTVLHARVYGAYGTFTLQNGCKDPAKMNGSGAQSWLTRWWRGGQTDKYNLSINATKKDTLSKKVFTGSTINEG